MSSRETPVRIFQMVETGRSTLNEPIVEEVTWRAVFASAETIRGKEVFEAGQRYSETVFRLTFDFYDVEGLSASMGLEMEGRRFDVKDIRPGYRRHDETVVEAVAHDAGAAVP